MSAPSRSNWNLEVLIGFCKERGKPEYLSKNLSEQGREPTTNSTHVLSRRQDSNLGNIGGRRVLSHLCCRFVSNFNRDSKEKFNLTHNSSTESLALFFFARYYWLRSITLSYLGIARFFCF